MKILVVGSGGREHAIKHTFEQQGHITVSIPEYHKDWDYHSLAQYVIENDIDLTVVGPESHLAAGIVDIFHEHNLKIFGPSKIATLLESSKGHAKRFMGNHQIPTAKFFLCNTSEGAKQSARMIFNQSGGVVIKPNGLTAGKGVTCCHTVEEAEEAIDLIMEQSHYGKAGEEVVVEELLTGPEVSILAFCDGKTVVPMIPSQDHKRLLEGDKGPNTGGVGAYTPLPFLTENDLTTIYEEIINRTNRGLQSDGIEYKGVLYFGIMLTPTGPKLLEYNCRFGDPEAQVVLPLLDSDLASIMISCIDGSLDQQQIKWKNKAAACIVMVSEGYPERCETGFEIQGLNALKEGVFCFHAGTRKNNQGKFVTAGGRVLGITALGDTLPEALDAAYQGVAQIRFQGARYRKDIGSGAHTLTTYQLN